MDQYFTSDKAAELLIERILPLSQQDVMNVCEPCAGDGALVKAFKKKRPEALVHAYELDKILCEKHEWMNADFLKEEIVKCDIVICNPPFSSGRDEDGNGRRGKDMALNFLIKACEWAPLLGFIMHQNKGNTGFAHQVWKIRPDVALVHHECINKVDSTFKTPKGIKFVPCAIYIYRTGQQNVVEPVLYKSMVCDDLEFLNLNDGRCNLIVKSWGSMNRVGRLVTIDTNEIAEHTSKQRKSLGKHGVDMHFFSKNVQLSVQIMERMIPDILQFLSYARDCSNVKITPAQFIFFYNKHK